MSATVIQILLHILFFGGGVWFGVKTTQKVAWDAYRERDRWKSIAIIHVKGRHDATLDPDETLSYE